MARTEAQKRASQKWEAKNKEKRYIERKKCYAKSYINNNATIEDLEELEELIKERKQNESKEIEGNTK